MTSSSQQSQTQITIQFNLDQDINAALLQVQTKLTQAQKDLPQEALLAASPVRLRPILMTSVATIAGALPQAFALGAGSEVMRPMAISVIGGVILSTLLTS